MKLTILSRIRTYSGQKKIWKERTPSLVLCLFYREAQRVRVLVVHVKDRKQLYISK